MKISLLFFFFIITLPGFSQVNLTNGLVAHYSFNGNANDVSGNGYNPVFNNAVLAAGKEGIPNTAYYFNGSSSYMQIANHPSLNPQELSLCARIKPTGFYHGTCYNNCIIDKGANDYQPGDYTLRFTQGAYTGSCFVDDSIHQNFTGFNYLNPGASLYTPYVVKDTWYDVVYTVSQDSLKLYVDGILKWKASRQMPIGVNAEDVFFGKKDKPGYPYWFKGIMDDIRIYNRAINSAEVDSIYKCVSVGISSQPNNFTVCKSGDARFSASAISAISYQWQVNTGGTVWSDVTNNSTYSGATTTTLNISGVTGSMNNFKYRFVASNLCNSATSSPATLLLDQVNLTNGLVAHYPFNGNANDVSGNGNNPIFNNAVLTAGKEGVPNTAYYFNGSNNYMQIASNSSLNPQELSLCARIKVMGFYHGICYNNCIIDRGASDYQPGNYTLRYSAGAYTASCNIDDLIHQNFSAFTSTNPGQGLYTPYVAKDVWYDLVYTLSRIL